MHDTIYESLDNSLTITCRVRGTHENSEQMLSLGLQEFMPMSHVIKLAKSSIKEQNLRHEYPMLNELWLQYQTMLRIVSNGE